MTKPMERYSEWRALKAVAQVLYERGPITAKYAGEANDIVAEFLDKVLPRAQGKKWSRPVVGRLVNRLEDFGYICVTPSRKDEPTRQVVREIRWSEDYNPEFIQWEPERPARPEPIKEPNLRERLARAERQLAFVLTVLSDLGVPVPSFDQAEENNPS